MRRAVSPGEVLQIEFMTPLGVSQRALGEILWLSRYHVRQLLEGRLPIDFSRAEQLSRYFETTVMFWINLQIDYDQQQRRKAKRNAKTRSKS